MMLLVEHPAQRLDLFLAQRGVVPSRTVAARLVKNGSVLVNGQPSRASRALNIGDSVIVVTTPPAPARPAPEAIQLDVVHEDDDLLVINKPAGMVVHPGAGRIAGTLVNALLARHENWPSSGGPMRPGIVHRLDKGTSGLLIVARTEAAHRKLSAAIAAREVERMYLAICLGTLSGAGVVEAPIGRSPRDRRMMAVVEAGRHANTTFEAIERLRGATLLRVRLGTGRTHQIRVHLSAIAHPLVGDATYGRKSDLIDRPALHSERLVFDHPRTGNRIDLQVPPPADFEEVLRRLRLP
jgi:23S rRNA pseudouridine1911/1915/1917 synthase